MRKPWYLVLVSLLILSLTLVGCGKQDQETVLKDLTDLKTHLKSYESKATMTVTANNSQQKYFIETWYQAPHYYRIALGNDQNQITQVIVRNDDGIFVVSPQLKKSFRFKGDWAENQGHVYLYHAAIDRVLQAQDKKFSAENGSVSFTMKMEPENPLVSTQRVTLKENGYEPQQIALLDKDNKAIVSVDFDSFKTGVEFKKDAFTPESAMAMAPSGTKPVLAGAKDFGVIEPRYVPSGAKLLEPQETQSSVMLRFAGKDPFTIIEQRPKAVDSNLYNGQVVDLWGSTAVLTGNEGDTRTLQWFHDGVEFSLTGKMTSGEMIKVAQSMINSGGK
jgi:outer membrane lipoprotein-sorting protein